MPLSSRMELKVRGVSLGKGVGSSSTMGAERRVEPACIGSGSDSTKQAIPRPRGRQPSGTPSETRSGAGVDRPDVLGPLPEPSGADEAGAHRVAQGPDPRAAHGAPAV